MPTILKLALDAEEYKRDLEAVIAETRAAAQALGETQAKLQFTVDAEQAKSELSDLPQVKDQQLKVTADTAGAVASVEAVAETDVPDKDLLIEADASPTEEAIDDINGTELPDKVVRIRIPNADEAMRQLDQTGDAANTAGMNAAQSFRRAGTAVAAVSGALGGINPQISVIGQSLTALSGGPLTIAVAGFGLLAVAGVKAYQSMTVSADEFAAKCETVSVKLGENRQKLEEYDASAGQLIARLKELSSVEASGLTTKQATAQILATLQSRYGDLGARIDETTGKLRNQAEVEARLNQARTREKARALDDEAENAGSQAEAAYMKIKGNEWSTTEVGAQKQFREMRKTMSPDQLIAAMEAKSRSATSEEEIRGYAEVAQRLREERDKKRKAAETRQGGYEDAAEKIAEAEAAKRALRDTERQNRMAERDRAFSSERFADRRAVNRQEQYEEAAAARGQALDRARNLQGQLNRVDSDWTLSDPAKAQARADLERQIAEAKKEAAEWDARAQGYLEQKQQAERAGTDEFVRQKTEARQLLEYNQLLIEGKYREAAASKLDYEFRQKGLTLTQEQRQALLQLQEAEARQESGKRIADAQEEVRLQRLLLSGKYEEAEAAKLEAEARKAGRELSPEEKQKRLAAAEEGRQLTLQKSLFDQADSLLGQAMKASGQGAEYEQQKALRDAERAKGGKLTEEEAQNVKSLFSLTERLTDLRNEPGVRGMTDVQTNALTARGGFNGAVRLPDTEKYNREIAQTGKKQAELLKEIKDICEKLGTF